MINAGKMVDGLGLAAVETSLVFFLAMGAEIEIHSRLAISTEEVISPR